MGDDLCLKAAPFARSERATGRVSRTAHVLAFFRWLQVVNDEIGVYIVSDENGAQPWVGRR
jgi:hypothetical protein